MAVGIAGLPQQLGLLDVAPGDVSEGHRNRQEPTILIHRHDLMLAKSLAARHPAHVGEDHVDRIDLRMLREKGAGFVDRVYGSGHSRSFRA
jgi:hypothetical protein